MGRQPLKPYGHPINLCSPANVKIGARCHLITGGPVLAIVSFEIGELIDGPSKGKERVNEVCVLWFNTEGELRRAVIDQPEKLLVIVE